MKFISLIFISVLITSCGPLDLEKEYNKGLRLYKIEEYEKAIKSFDLIIEQTDTFYDCFLYSGFSYRELNLTELASIDFSKLMNSQDSVYQKLGYVNRGGTNYDVKDYKFALYDYKKALEYEDSNEIIMNMVSHMYFATGDKDSGCYYYKKSLQFGKTDFSSEITQYCDSTTTILSK